MKSLTDETFTRMLGSTTEEKVLKVSKVSKTQTKRAKTTTVVQTSIVEPTAPGDHGTTSSAVKPTPATSKRKRPSTKTPTKPKRGLLEDEIPEENPVATQKQQETTVVTSSQQLDISQSEQTPHESSQKNHVVSQRETHHEAYESLDYMLISPSPGAISLFTPPPSPSYVLPTMKPLFEAIDKTQDIPSSSPSPINESTHQQVTGTEENQLANPRTEEVTPLEFNVTLGEFSSEAATTDVETIVSQQDSGYIAKTSLKATTDEAAIVTVKSVGSPQNQDKGASGSFSMDSPPRTEPVATTTVRNSDDPINLGDGLKYQELRDRVHSIEISIADIKTDLKTIMVSLAALTKS